METQSFVQNPWSCCLQARLTMPLNGHYRPTRPTVRMLLTIRSQWWPMGACPLHTAGRSITTRLPHGRPHHLRKTTCQLAIPIASSQRPTLSVTMITTEIQMEDMLGPKAPSSNYRILTWLQVLRTTSSMCPLSSHSESQILFSRTAFSSSLNQGGLNIWSKPMLTPWAK